MCPTIDQCAGSSQLGYSHWLLPHAGPCHVKLVSLCCLLFVVKPGDLIATMKWCSWLIFMGFWQMSIEFVRPFKPVFFALHHFQVSSSLLLLFAFAIHMAIYCSGFSISWVALVPHSGLLARCFGLSGSLCAPELQNWNNKGLYFLKAASPALQRAKAEQKRSSRANLGDHGHRNVSKQCKKSTTKEDQSLVLWSPKCCTFKILTSFCILTKSWIQGRAQRRTRTLNFQKKPVHCLIGSCCTSNYPRTLELFTRNTKEGFT